MKEERGDKNIQRILVALDASPHSLAALEAAAELAAILHAELAGIFVEDLDLLRAAELPHAVEFGLYSARRRTLDRARIEEELRALAGTARRALGVYAARADVRFSFRVVQGSVSREVLTAAADADMVSVGRVGWSLPGQREVGSTASAVLTSSPGLAMVLEHGIRLGLPVLAVYDGSPAGARAVTVAANLTRARGGRLAVAVVGEDEDVVRDLERQAAELIGNRVAEVRYEHLLGAAGLNLAPILRALGCGLLIIPGGSGATVDQTLLRRLFQVGCPMLVVR
jgi:nucleotide-binding universal stress UspA family protein